jgi:hypothetical protein
MSKGAGAGCAVSCGGAMSVANGNSTEFATTENAKTHGRALHEPERRRAWCSCTTARANSQRPTGSILSPLHTHV